MAQQAQQTDPPVRDHEGAVVRRGAGPRLIVALLTVAVLAVLGVVGVVALAMAGSPGPGDSVSIEVPPGASAATVAGQLRVEGVVRSGLAFRLRARSRGLDRGMQAGVYVMETGMSVDEAIDRLEAGPAAPKGLRYTIPEGLTVAETLETLARQTPYPVQDYREVLDRRLLKLPGWVPDAGRLGPDARDPYEGLLFPETYEVPQEASPQAILQKMVDQLDKIVAAMPADRPVRMRVQGFDRYKLLIVASLVEKEAKIPDERATIAGVIYNRLAADQPLSIDAANIYALGRHVNQVTYKDLEVDSAYNLYIHSGLPPTPIAAPGSASLRAAYEPESHDFYYYVKRDLEGHHSFARTSEEHQVNVARYRELQERAASEPPTPSGQERVGSIDQSPN